MVVSNWKKRRFNSLNHQPQSIPQANNNIENLFDFSTDENDPFKVFDAPSQPSSVIYKTSLNNIFDLFDPLNNQSQADFLKP